MSLIKRSSRMLEFIANRIQESQQKQKQTKDAMERLKLAVAEVSYAHILRQYMQYDQYIFDALLGLSKAYLYAESYNEALTQARLARKEAENRTDGSKEKALLLIADCMIHQNRHEDAYEILSTLKPQEHQNNIEFLQQYYELLLISLVQLGSETKANELLCKYQQLIIAHYGTNTSEYGFLLVKKGKSLSKFNKYSQALTNLNKGIDILIQRRCKQKKQIAQIYLTISSLHRKQNNLEKQYSSLICAYSMARQLDNPQKQTLSILHMLANNLIQRQDYQKALKQLKKAKELQKEMYGQSSAQIARTTKKISEILSALNLCSQALKSEQEYSRIVSTSGRVGLKDKTLNLQKA